MSAEVDTDTETYSHSFFSEYIATYFPSIELKTLALSFLT
jgi:hypothetical protein